MNAARWHDYEKRGWSWSIGWNPNYGGYYARAWRDFPKDERGKIKRKRVNGRWFYRECIIEGGRTIAEAESKVWQMLDGVDGLAIPKPKDGSK